jgi:fatty acid desaturase
LGEKLTHNLNAAAVLADPTTREFLKFNNYLATRDLTFRVLVQFTLMYLVYFLFSSEKFILGVFVFYILAIWHSFWGYAGLGHELVHSRVFSNKNVNLLLYYFSSALVYSNPVFFRSSHLHHHAHTFAEDDTEAKVGQRWGGVEIVFYMTIDVPFMCRRLFYTFINSFGYLYSDGVFHKISSLHQHAAAVILLIQIVIGVSIYACTRNLLFNILWLMLPFTGQMFNRLLSQSQHVGLDAHRNHGPLQYSRSIRLPKLATYLYAGMNYHAEHHLIPSIPYYNLYKLSDYLVSMHGHQVTDWYSFYGKQFFSLLRTKTS